MAHSRIASALGLLPVLVVSLLGLAVPAAQAAAPANNSFGSATAVTLGTRVAGTTDGATMESGEPDPDEYSNRDSVWYRWTALASGHVIVTSAQAGGGSSQRFGVAVYDGSWSTQVDSRSSWVDFQARTGHVYYLQIVSEVAGSPGSFSLEVQHAGTVHVAPTAGGRRVSDGLCVVLDPAADGTDGMPFISGTDYSLGVPAGRHTVYVHSCSTGATHRNLAPVSIHVNVAAGGTTRLAPAMVAGAVITGKITRSANDTSYAGVAALRPGQTYGPNGEADAAGDYTVDSIGTGTYWLEVWSNSLTTVFGYPNATSEARLVPVSIRAGCVVTFNADIARLRTTLVKRDCSRTPECHSATAASAHAAMVAKKDLKKLRKAERKHKRAHGAAKPKLAKKVKKLHKRLKKAKRSRTRAASTAYTMCH